MTVSEYSSPESTRTDKSKGCTLPLLCLKGSESPKYERRSIDVLRNEKQPVVDLQLKKSGLRSKTSKIGSFRKGFYMKKHGIRRCHSEKWSTRDNYGFSSTFVPYIDEPIYSEVSTTPDHTPKADELYPAILRPYPNDISRVAKVTNLKRYASSVLRSDIERVTPVKVNNNVKPRKRNFTRQDSISSSLRRKPKRANNNTSYENAIYASLQCNANNTCDKPIKSNRFLTMKKNKKKSESSNYKRYHSQPNLLDISKPKFKDIPLYDEISRPSLQYCDDDPSPIYETINDVMSENVRKPRSYSVGHASKPVLRKTKSDGSSKTSCFSEFKLHKNKSVKPKLSIPPTSCVATKDLWYNKLSQVIAEEREKEPSTNTIQVTYFDPVNNTDIVSIAIIIFYFLI